MHIESLLPKRTKIVATIGPASESPEMMVRLIQAGANVFRFNMKHATHEWHHERIGRALEVAESLKTTLGILIDLQGPEIRIETRDHLNISLEAKQEAEIVAAFTDTDAAICIPHPVVFEILDLGDTILIDDGRIELEVVSKQAESIVVKSYEPIEIKHRKGVNLPGKPINLPSLIDDDLEKLDMAGKTKVDFVALSFSRSQQDIEILRAEMEKRNIRADIVAKIESQEALEHLDELIESSDAIMVARGDLGIEVPIEQLAYWQKKIVTACRLKRKPVIVATEMLQSMVDNPRPTRAEASDVGNSIYDGTDAIMLSAETASGRFPIKAVQAMTRIAAFTETRTILSKQPFIAETPNQLVAHAAMTALKRYQEFDIQAVVVFTETGHSAKILASFRPRIPIIAVTDHHNILAKLGLVYGIYPVHKTFPKGKVVFPNPVLDDLVSDTLLETGRRVLVIHGHHWQIEGQTNAMALITV